MSRNIGHYAKECCSKKTKEANILQEEDFIGMVTKIMMMENQQDLWLDSGVTCLVTPFHGAFTSYKEFEEEKVI